MPHVITDPVRRLDLNDLDLAHLAGDDEIGGEVSPIVDATDLPIDNRNLRLVNRALELGFAGVILSGPPGTGKSWYAQQIAVALTGKWEAVRSVQFHPSYQYEDFVFGYRSNANGMFEPTAKEFALICREAAADPAQRYVMVIDEISRSDVIRVFGEALTYLEMDKRDRAFSTSMGEELVIPKNLVVIGTMNPWDKGVDELDAALERRFAQIDILPDAKQLEMLLVEAGAEQPFLGRLIAFFELLQSESLERVRLGHAYFLKCVDAASAQDIWTLRLLPTLRRACSLDLATFRRLEEAWKGVVADDIVSTQGDGEAAVLEQ